MTLCCIEFDAEFASAESSPPGSRVGREAARRYDWIGGVGRSFFSDRVVWARI